MTDNTGDARSDRTDFWTGLVLAALGLAFTFASWQMPLLEGRGINPLTAPGIVPGVLGVALVVLGLVLAFRRYHPERGRIGIVGIIGTGSGRRNLTITFLLNVTFALILVGRAPFWLATFAYLIVFMGTYGLLVERGGEPRKQVWRKRAALILALALATTAGIVYLFETLFLVRLP